MGLGNKSLWETANGFSHQIINTEQHSGWVCDVHECVCVSITHCRYNNSASLRLKTITKFGKVFIYCLEKQELIFSEP